MAQIRMTVEGVQSAAFLPHPAGGGHTTPASTTHGLVEVTATMTTKVQQPRAAAVKGRGVGSTVNGDGGVTYIVPNRYVTIPVNMGPSQGPAKIGWSSARARPVPVPAEQEVPTSSIAFRPATVGGSKENTPWPKAWQKYTKT